VLACTECWKTADSFELGWSAFSVEDPDAPGVKLLLTYCADCLAREFGGLLRWLTYLGPGRSAGGT
jgi:hypothetical protein